MKLVLGMEVGLSPGDFVLKGDPATSPKRERSPFPNATWYGCRPQPRGLVLEGDP